jgi:hypothetical protein
MCRASVGGAVSTEPVNPAWEIGHMRVFHRNDKRAAEAPTVVVQPSNEHVVEIRFEANARILDNRGAWAEALMEHLGMQQWQIVANRLDVFDKDRKRLCFVSFKNAGFSALDTPNQNYFPDQANRFLRRMFDLPDFRSPIVVARIGVRSKFCTPFDGTYSEMCDRFSERYACITPQAREAIGREAKLLDIGAPLNMVDEDGNFNTMAGPVTDDEAAQYFQKDDGFAPVALFYDIDYWRQPKRGMDATEVTNAVAQMARAGWNRHDRLRRLILEAE